MTNSEFDFDIVIGTTGGSPSEFEACAPVEAPAGGFLVFKGCATVEAPAPTPMVTGEAVVNVVSDPRIVTGTEITAEGFGVFDIGMIPPLPEVLSAPGACCVWDDGLLGSGPEFTTLLDAPTKVPIGPG